MNLLLELLNDLILLLSRTTFWYLLGIELLTIFKWALLTNPLTSCPVTNPPYCLFPFPSALWILCFFILSIYILFYNIYISIINYNHCLRHSIITSGSTKYWTKNISDYFIKPNDSNLLFKPLSLHLNTTIHSLSLPTSSTRLSLFRTH